MCLLLRLHFPLYTEQNQVHFVATYFRFVVCPVGCQYRLNFERVKCFVLYNTKPNMYQSTLIYLRGTSHSNRFGTKKTHYTMFLFFALSKKFSMLEAIVVQDSPEPSISFMYHCASKRKHVYAMPLSISWTRDPWRDSGRGFMASETGVFLLAILEKCAPARGTRA